MEICAIYFLDITREKEGERDGWTRKGEGGRAPAIVLDMLLYGSFDLQDSSGTCGTHSQHLLDVTAGCAHLSI